MPYKFETSKQKIKREDDKRVKLSLEDREQIKKLYATGLYSQRELAKKFNVSRKLICLYSDDKKLEKHKADFKKRQKTGMYYDKSKHNEYIKKYRKHKYELYLSAKLLKEGKDNEVSNR